MELSRNNHYVPIWYQKEFLKQGESSLFYLDLHPKIITTPQGKKIKLKKIRKLGPKKCFKEYDLYIWEESGIIIDEYEREFFGSVDFVGKKLLDPVINNDYEELAKYFELYFEYLSLQYLRTPKGLNFLQKLFTPNSQFELLKIMKFFRTYNCTMWAEGVHEVVTAKFSREKFIVTDCPVTFYNKKFFPLSRLGQQKFDPMFFWVGTQTIFPLDQNHCFIVSHLDYAKQPELKEPKKDRINPRLYDHAVFRIDAIIRERDLNEDDILKINFILKSQAFKFIGGQTEKSLFPEKKLKDIYWPKLGNVLIPPSKGLWKYGGKTYFGGKDESLLWYSDQYGRNPTTPLIGDVQQAEFRKFKSRVRKLYKKFS